MAMKIVAEECLKCGACVMVCPRESISEETDDGGDVVYLVDKGTCTECEDDYDEPQCVVACPVDNCILPIAS